MTFAKFCKIRGFTLEEFRQLQESIAKFVNEIVEENRSNYGLYKEVYFLYCSS